MSTITLPNTTTLPLPGTGGPAPGGIGAPGETTPVTGAGALEASSSPPPLYLDFGFSEVSLALLGLRMPQAPGDAAAILAEVSDALDKLMDEDRNRRREAAGSALRSLFGNLASIAAALSGHIEAYNGYAAEKEEKTQLRTAKTAERDAKVGLRNGLNDDIAGYDQRIEDLKAQIAAAEADDKPTGALRVALATVESQRSAVVAQRDALNGQIEALNGEIGTLTGEIETAQRNMDTEEAAIKTLEAAREAALVMLANFAMTVAQRDEAVAAGEAGWDVNITRLFENLAANLAEFQAALAESARETDTRITTQTRTDTEPQTVNVENVATPGVDPEAPPPPDSVLARLNAAAVALSTALAQIISILAGMDPLPDHAATDEDAPRLRIAV